MTVASTKPVRVPSTPKLLLSVAMFIAAYFPLVIIFIVHDIDDAGWHLRHPATCTALALLVAGCVAVTVRILSRLSPTRSGRITDTSSKSMDMFSYSLPYLTSFGGFSFSDWRDVAVTLVVLALMFVLAYRTRTIFLNPLVALAGFSLYEGKLELQSDPRQWHVLFISRDSFPGEGECVVEQLAHHIYFAAAR
jgi:hypothetical protein